MKNRLHSTFILMLMVVAGLYGLYYLPPLGVADVMLRKVDIIADVRTKKTEPLPTVEEDTNSIVVPVVRPEFVDTCRAGLTCIEDFSDSTMRGMTNFYEKLDQIATLDRPVRIAYMGDSFIEADIFTADLREMLQKKYGGCGVGYVSISNPISGFRRTVLHRFKGWKRHNVTDTIGFNHQQQDISNQYFIPSEGASVTLSGQKKYASLLDTCEMSTIYFRTMDDLNIRAHINGVKARDFAVKGREGLQSLTVKGRIGTVKWTVEDVDSVCYFYGATMDPSRGVVVDNFSVRGSSGKQLMHVPYSIMKQYDRQREYDLVVLQYGLNVVFASGRNYDYYTKAMIPVVEKIKQVFPKASILIVGVGDREERNEYGELHTMPAVKSMIVYQKKLAALTHVAFWNMYEAMGGEGSIVEMVNSKPPMANLDYTHINFRGGKHLAGILFETLMYGKSQHDKRKAYENGN